MNRSVLFVLGVLALPANAQPTVAGSTPGSFRVTESGAAEYRIPIRVPPGIAGVEPKLALAYNSQSGNGLMGVGWGLEGLSAITRCPRTIAQEGILGRVSYDWNDRYCLDGQKLVLVSGSYGGGTAELRTARETFTKIEAYGDTGPGGPTWFRAWTKSGEIIEYGNTADSKIEAQGKGQVRVWAVNRITDRAGNHMTFTYGEDNAYGDYRPLRIDYSGNTAAGTTPGYSVRFVYQSRTDRVPAYVDVSKIETLYRLLTVQTYIGESLQREYQLTYQTSPNTNRSRITSIRECGAGGSSCLPPTQVGWLAANGGISTTNNAHQSLSGNWRDTFLVFPGDYDGDGRTDLFLVGASAVGSYFCSGTTLVSAASCVQSVGPGNDWKNLFSVYPGDYDGDGRTDLFLVGPVGIGSFFCSGTTLVSTASCAQTVGPENDWKNVFHIYPGDYDGNGRTDLYLVGPGGVGSFFCSGSTLISSASCSPSAGPENDWKNVFVAYPGDYDGDGRTDLYLVGHAGGYFCSGLYLISQAACVQTLGGENDWRTHYIIHVGDYNGDGRADFFLIGSGSSHWCSGHTLATTANCATSNTDDWRNTYTAHAGDYDGDGLTDLLLIGAGSSHFCSGTRLISTASCVQVVWGDWKTPFDIYTGDFDGSGSTDAFLVGSYNSYFAAGMSPRADLASTFTDGFGSQASVAYKSLTDPSVYTKDGPASYPEVSLQPAVTVVSSASSDNGIAGLVTSTYAYGGAKSHLTGRGFLGFRWLEATSQQTGIKSRTDYRQDWPYVGMPSQATTRQSSGALLRQVTNTLGCNDFVAGCGIAPNRRYFPFVSQSVEAGNDLNGAALPTVTTSTQYDTYGNPISIAVGTGDGHSKTTTNTFVNDAVNWILGRLTRSAVQSTNP